MWIIEPDELVDRGLLFQETGTKTILKKENAKRRRAGSEDTLQIAVKRRDMKSNREKKDNSIEYRVPTKSKERKKAFQRSIERNREEYNGKTRTTSRRLETPCTFLQRWAQ